MGLDVNNIQLGQMTSVGKGWQWKVRLDGRIVGAIKKTRDANREFLYQYKPRGGRGGEHFSTLQECIRSLLT